MVHAATGRGSARREFSGSGVWKVIGVSMRVFALSDPHLSFAVKKPMDIFGAAWEDHENRILSQWTELVRNEDLVIVPGDISWGLKFEEVYPDLMWLSRLPGRKLILKGNHDLWWTSPAKLNPLFDGMTFLQNNHFSENGVAVCGTRGWILPELTADWTAHDQKIFRRELLRLEMGLKSAMTSEPERLIVALHYPPVDAAGRDTEFTKLIEQYPVSDVIYGHLHGSKAVKHAFRGRKKGIRYHLVACDQIGFRPKLIWDTDGKMD